MQSTVIKINQLKVKNTVGEAEMLQSFQGSYFAYPAVFFIFWGIVHDLNDRKWPITKTVLFRSKSEVLSFVNDSLPIVNSEEREALSCPE